MIYLTFIFIYLLIPFFDDVQASCMIPPSPPFFTCKLASQLQLSLYPHHASYHISSCNLISPHTLASLCYFVLLHFTSFPCIASPLVLPFLLYTHSSLSHQDTIPYPQIAPSEPHWAYALVKPYHLLFLI